MNTEISINVLFKKKKIREENIFNMAVEYENLKGVKLLHKTKSSIERNIMTNIKMLQKDDDLNANILSEEKESIKNHLSRIGEINEKIKEICKKVSLDTGECGFDKQKTKSNKFHYGINKRFSVLGLSLSTNENASSSHGRYNHSKE